jgi:hypothetical protein
MYEDAENMEKNGWFRNKLADLSNEKNFWVKKLVKEFEIENPYKKL